MTYSVARCVDKMELCQSFDLYQRYWDEQVCENSKFQTHLVQTYLCKIAAIC